MSSPEKTSLFTKLGVQGKTLKEHFNTMSSGMDKKQMATITAALAIFAFIVSVINAIIFFKRILS